jgi:hypothetical protein
MEEKKKIDEFMFGGGSLLDIQNQVDDLVTAEAILERRFDGNYIQATTLMVANEAAKSKDNVVDVDLKWIEQSIYDDDDDGECLISTREIDLVAKREGALRKNRKKRTNMIPVIIFYIKLTSCLSMQVRSQKKKMKTWMRISMKTSLKPSSCNGVLKKLDFILS